MHNDHDKNTLTDDYLLGTLLVEWGVIAPAELDLIRDECEGTTDVAQAKKLATGVRRQLGELLCEFGHITPAQLNRALAEQRRTGQKLGTILVRSALLTRPELDAALAFQTQQGNPSGSGRLKLGEILIASGAITFAQLDAALEQQTTSGRRLGEELVAAGYIRPQELERGLQLQQKLIAAIFASVLAIAGASHSSPVDAGQVRSTLGVTTEVLPSVRVQSEYQVSEIDITPVDVARGYVDVPAGSRFTVKVTKNASYEVDFYPRVDLFNAVEIDGLGTPLRIGADGGTFVATSLKSRTTSASLGYRFMLNEHAQPGHYPWPLALQVRPRP
ncbi:MAG: hypothetical protein ACRET1_05505 [Burkholderiales bacterium]